MVNRIERGWCGHFVGGANCKFRRNTLLDRGDCKIVVSTVGNYCPHGYELDAYPVQLAVGRYYETMAFHSDANDDADLMQQIPITSDWSIAYADADFLANAMHETVVAEVTEKLLQGYYRAPMEFVREIDQRRDAFLRQLHLQSAEEAWNEAVKVCNGIAINIVREVFREEGSDLTDRASGAILSLLHEEFDEAPATD